MTDETRDPQVKVKDKRRSPESSDPEPAPGGAEQVIEAEVVAEGGAEQVVEAEVIAEGGADEVRAPDYLDDLLRLRAEFDNYRKRVMREQTATIERASAHLIERLLPVLDNLERALEHGDGGGGVELVYKELKRVLEQDGLEEIPAEDVPFDPRWHDAVEAVEEPGLTEPQSRRVYRRGYKLKQQVLRPAMVLVARPPESADEPDPDAAVEG